MAERLEETIAEAIAASPVPVVHHRIERNVGLARALTEGLSLSSHDIVARMDADDISLPERFAKQVPLVEDGLDLVGTGMFEFLDDVGSIVGQRIPRTEHAEIVRYARFHDPFSHPTVVYRRSAVEHAGGYQPLGLMEDYWLFARMIDAGARRRQHRRPARHVPGGVRRVRATGGSAQWRSEVALQRAMRSIGFTTRREFVRNVTIRGLYRFVPERLRRVAYRRFIADAGRNRRRVT